MPTVLIDADGCPVVDLTIRLCKGHKVAVLILCDTAHRIQREGAEALVFDKGADSVDFRRKPLCEKYLNTTDNIDTLLERRWQNKKLLRAGKYPKGPAKRTNEQDEGFAKSLRRLLKGNVPL